MRTNLTYTQGMQVVNNINELRGINQIYGGVIFQDGDVVEIPDEPQIQTYRRPNNKYRIEVGVKVNNCERWINLNAFTKLPPEGDGDGFRAAFQKAHPVNDKIAQGDACAQILALSKLGKLRVHKEENYDVILVFNEANQKYERKKDENGKDQFKRSRYSIFEQITE